MIATGEGKKAKSVEWYTPKWIFDALGIEFDLDPCSPHDHESFVPAKQVYTVFDDGLNKDWAGKRVWLNPPYGTQTVRWVEKMMDHANGIALLFSRTDARWCQRCMREAHGILFLAGRIQFVPGHENKHKVVGCGAGTVMFAFGEDCADALTKMADRGVFIRQVPQKPDSKSMLFDHAHKPTENLES